MTDKDQIIKDQIIEVEMNEDEQEQYGQEGDPPGDSWKKTKPPLPTFEAPPSFYVPQEEK